MSHVYYEKDADLDFLKDKTVAIIGYGSQGHAHALNLKESGVKVVVAEREGSDRWEAAIKDGLKPMSAAEAAKQAQIVQMLVPDTAQPAVYRSEIEPHLNKGDMLMFAHGFNIHYSQIEPAAGIDVTMIAPKGPGHLVRRTYQEGSGTPALIAVHQDATGKAKEIALAYARGIGSAQAGVIETTFKEETETDLFGEQVVLCGGLSELIRAGFDTLVDAGYQPEIAYFECLHEVKLIVDLIYEGGISQMRYSISDTAKYGDISRGPRIITEETRREMKKILGEIQNGAFATEWILENRAGLPRFKATLKKDAEHKIETVGKKLRSMMSWLKK